jgi:hypothetical protein
VRPLLLLLLLLLHLSSAAAAVDGQLRYQFCRYLPALLLRYQHQLLPMFALLPQLLQLLACLLLQLAQYLLLLLPHLLLPVSLLHLQLPP